MAIATIYNFILGYVKPLDQIFAAMHALRCPQCMTCRLCHRLDHCFAEPHMHT